jgi:glucose-6-phosphate 1-dehydrogenase
LRHSTVQKYMDPENPRKEGAGDLACKSLFPALRNLARRARLEIPVIGIARGGHGRDRLLQRIRASLDEHGGVDAAAITAAGRRSCRP